MKTEFPYFNDSDIGYVDPDFLDENEKQFLVERFKKIDVKNSLINEEQTEEISSILEGE